MGMDEPSLERVSWGWEGNEQSFSRYVSRYVDVDGWNNSIHKCACKKESYKIYDLVSE